jgi:hypothetical protein
MNVNQALSINAVLVAALRFRECTPFERSAKQQALGAALAEWERNGSPQVKIPCVRKAKRVNG